jgi:hypothetical protein
VKPFYLSNRSTFQVHNLYRYVKAVALTRFHLAPFLANATTNAATSAAAHAGTKAAFDWMLLIPLAYTLSFLIALNKYPEWYSRNRETIVMANRLVGRCTS